MRTTYRAIALIIISSICAGTGQLFWKRSAFTLTLSSLFNVYFIIGVALYALATVLMTLAFREGELSVLHPLLATTYIWLILISPLFLVGETLSVAKVVGAIFIFLGVCSISKGRKSQ